MTSVKYNLGIRCAKAAVEENHTSFWRFDADRIAKANPTLDLREIESLEFRAGYAEGIRQFRPARSGAANAPRVWGSCVGCGSATLRSYLNKSSQCKHCEAKALAEALPVDYSEDPDADPRSQQAEDEALESMGLGEGHDSLPYSQRFEVTVRRVKVDPKQKAFDDVRSAARLERRDHAAPFKGASVSQFNALKRLGWDAATLGVLKLSIADASRLMQRGPVWGKAPVIKPQQAASADVKPELVETTISEACTCPSCSKAIVLDERAIETKLVQCKSCNQILEISEDLTLSIFA